MDKNDPRMIFSNPRPDGKNWNQNQLLYEYEGARRILHLYGPILDAASRMDETSSAVITDSLFALDSQNHDPIHLVLDTPGGAIWPGLALCDAIALVHSPVYTIARTAYSMGAIILAAGEPGHRYVMPNAHLMLHLPQGQFQGDPIEMAKSIEDFERLKKELIDRLVRWGVHKTPDEILAEIDRAKWLWAQDAIDFGIADAIVPKGLLSNPPTKQEEDTHLTVDSV